MDSPINQMLGMLLALVEHDLVMQERLLIALLLLCAFLLAFYLGLSMRAARVRSARVDSRGLLQAPAGDSANSRSSASRRVL